MKLTKHSTNRFYQSAVEWEAPKEYVDPIFNYLVHGFSPGGFFTSLLANDAFGALSRSHPANGIVGLKNLVGWINNLGLHNVAWGNYEVVDTWLKLSETERRKILESVNLIYSEQEEILKILKDEKTIEPIFY